MSLMQDRDGGELPIIQLAYEPVSQKEIDRLELTRAWSHALVVHGDHPASLLGMIAALNKMDLVITIDDKDRVSGVLTAKDLTNYLHQLSSAPNVILSDFTPLEIDADQRGIDWRTVIKGRRPQLYWCVVGKHETTENPCSLHPK